MSLIYPDNHNKSYATIQDAYSAWRTKLLDAYFDWIISPLNSNERLKYWEKYVKVRDEWDTTKKLFSPSGKAKH